MSPDYVPPINVPLSVAAAVLGFALIFWPVTRRIIFWARGRDAEGYVKRETP